jgi:hypothetical protein
MHPFSCHLISVVIGLQGTLSMLLAFRNTYLCSKGLLQICKNVSIGQCNNCYLAYTMQTDAP